jgi:putative FmdB family regulatory protein
MPFYEYECSNCKFYTEVMQKITDAPLAKCPSCGKKALKKLVSAPNFRLKGGGWYETDFKGDKESKRNLAGGDAEESSKSETASSDSSKTEPAKTEATPKTEAATISTSSGASAQAVGRSSRGGSSGGGSSSGGGGSGGRASSGGGGGSGGPKDSPGSKHTGGSTGRAAKPASRVAASKARTAPAVRGKAKPVARKKKARR